MLFISRMIVNVALTDSYKKKIYDFLNSHGYKFNHSDLAVYISDNDAIIACALLNGNTIQGICVEDKYQGDNLSAKLVTYIINTAASKNINDLFIFTIPSNLDKFSSLGFSHICSTSQVSLLERSHIGISKTVKQLASSVNKKGNNGAIVVNANPFTLGHQYLIETCSKKCDNLIVFVVQEDLSFFSFSKRFQMVSDGTKHLSNVTVLPSTQYIISRQTFPTYFIKENSSQFDKIYAELDASVFKEYFVPAFNINCRYVGSEPDCTLTNIYNNVLISILPKVEVIDRLTINGRPVSASDARKLYQAKDFNNLYKLLPQTTINLL